MTRPEEPVGADHLTDLALTQALELVRRVAAERRLASALGELAIQPVLPCPLQVPRGPCDAAAGNALVSLAKGEPAYAKCDPVEVIGY